MEAVCCSEIPVTYWTTWHYIPWDFTFHSLYLPSVWCKFLASSFLKMEAVCSSKMLVDFYQATWHYVREDITRRHHPSRFILHISCKVSGVIPRKPTYGLPCHLRVQVKDQGMVTLRTVSIHFAPCAIFLIAFELLSLSFIKWQSCLVFHFVFVSINLY